MKTKKRQNNDTEFETCLKQKAKQYSKKKIDKKTK